MKLERMARSGQIRRQAAMPVEDLLLVGRAAHGFQYIRRGMLERDVEIGEDLALRHQRDDLVDMRIGIDIVEPAPRRRTGPARFARSTNWARTSRPRYLLFRVFDVDAIGARILRDDEQLLDAGFDQPLGLIEHRRRRPAHQVAAQRRDDAEGAAVVAAFGDLQIGIVARRQPQALRRNEVELASCTGGTASCTARHDRLILVRAGDREHGWMRGADAVGLDAHAAGDDDPAVLIDRLADGRERFGLGRIEKAAGVHDDDVGRVIAGRDRR